MGERQILFLSGSFSIILLILSWHLLSISSESNQNLLPGPLQVVIAFKEWILSGEFYQDVIASMWRVFSGLIGGVTIGIILGLLTGRNKVINFLLSPILNGLKALPPVALLPIFITFLGIGDFAKIVSIVFACCFPVWINTHIGSYLIPEEYLRSAKLLTLRQSIILFKVIIPASMSYIIAGIRLGIALSFIMVYVSELAGASAGLGYQIASSHLAYRMDKMFAALLFLGALAAFSDQIFILIVRYFFPWTKFLNR